MPGLDKRALIDQRAVKDRSPGRRWLKKPRFIVAEIRPRVLPVADAPGAVMLLVQTAAQSAANSQTGLLHGGAHGVAHLIGSDQAEIMRPDAHAASKTDGAADLRRPQGDMNAADMPSLTVKGSSYERIDQLSLARADP
jgi:hypothetical protein